MNIDNFFQEQNEKFTIDTSKQEMHWQQLQAKIAKPTLKWKPYAAVATVAFLIGTTFYVLNNKKETSTIAQSPSTTSNTNTTTTNTTPLPIEQPITKPTAIESPADAPIVAPAKKETVKTTTPPTVVEKAITKKTINKQANFYIDLTKAPEVFTIDPKKENTLTCKQGSTLTIPANSIIDGNNNTLEETITVTVQEYYRYDGKAATNNATAAMIKYDFYKGEERVTVQPSQTVVIKMSNGLQNFKVLNDDDILSEKTIQQMTWVSNEKFFTDTRNKIAYSITLDKKFNANTFMSQLAFPSEKVIMAGDIVNNSIIFNNVPIGETVYFMSIGKINNKYFSCSKKLVTGNTSISEIDFVEISETLYKKQFEELSKLGQ